MNDKFGDMQKGYKPVREVVSNSNAGQGKSTSEGYKPTQQGPVANPNPPSGGSSVKPKTK